MTHPRPTGVGLLGLGALPEPMIERARGRVVTMLLVLAVAWTLDLAVPYALFKADGRALAAQYMAGVDLVSGAACLGMLALSAIRAVPSVRVLQASLGFLVGVSYCLAFLGMLHAYRTTGLFQPTVWVVVLITVFPLVVPLTSRAALGLGLTAAAMPALALATLEGLGWVDAPLSAYVLVSTHPMASALLAAVGARALRASTVDVAALSEQRGLLRAVLDHARTAFVLADPDGRVAYANAPASELLGGTVEGQDLAGVLAAAPDAVREALGEGSRETVLEQDGESWLIASQVVPVGFAPHRLYAAQRITQPLRRREIRAWRDLVRVLSHELNNTLAPLSSSLHLVRRIVATPEEAHRLPVVLEAMEDRVGHLGAFLRGYAELARLPAPRPREVDWAPFLGQLQALVPHVQPAEPPRAPGWFDVAQLEQVLINLLRNATDAGSPAEATTLEVREARGGFELTVADRGHGFSEEALREAFVPFYSTRPEGTGLGLPLAREIVEAHGGSTTIAARADGGTLVTCWLPGRPR